MIKYFLACLGLPPYIFPLSAAFLFAYFPILTTFMNGYVTIAKNLDYPENQSIWMLRLRSRLSAPASSITRVWAKKIGVDSGGCKTPKPLSVTISSIFFAKAVGEHPPAWSCNRQARRRKKPIVYTWAGSIIPPRAERSIRSMPYSSIFSSWPLRGLIRWDTLFCKRSLV